MTGDVFASFSRMLNLVSGVCLAVKLPISPTRGRSAVCGACASSFAAILRVRRRANRFTQAKFPGHRMIRLESISKQNGRQLVFIEASASLQKGEK
ncbi:hypothetical protein EN950_15510, partial [Mesorhizobium sp. M7A.F.Ca.US.007.01.1.1]